MSRTRLVALLLVMGTLAIYLPVSHHGFCIFDDDDYVTQNFTVQNGLTPQGIKWAFTTFHSGNWHPVTWLSHELDCEIFGLNAGMHHVENLLFHAANAVLLLALLVRLGMSFWPGAFVAALFAWHPMHVESVVWISERKDVLSTFFALLTLLAYVKYAKENRRGYFWLAFILFALGLMSKPMLVTLPFVMLLLDYWPLARFNIQHSTFSVKTVSKLVVEKIPFLLLVIASCIITFIAQHRGGLVISLEKLPLSNRLMDVPLAYANYLLKIFWPSSLSIFYPLPKAVSMVSTTAALAVLILITGAAWFLRKSRPYFLVGWLWFLGTLVPVIGLVQVGSALIADRYSYFPSIGIFLTIALAAAEAENRWHFKKAIMSTVAVMILIGCIFLTYHQLDFWRDDVALFSHAVEIAPGDSALRLSYGLALENAGRNIEALSQYETAAHLTPGWSRAHGALANLLVTLNRPDDALAEFRIALQLEPNHVLLLDNYGALLFKMGRFDEARTQLAGAMRINPADWRAPFLMGQLLLKENRDEEAIPFFQRALRCEPNNLYVLNYFAEVLASDEMAKVRNGRTALSLAETANRLSGGVRPDALDALAMAQAEQGDFANATKDAQAALDLAAALGMTNDLAAIRQRLELYQNKKPFRQSFDAASEPLSGIKKSGD